MKLLEDFGKLDLIQVFLNVETQCMFILYAFLFNKISNELFFHQLAIQNFFLIK